MTDTESSTARPIVLVPGHWLGAWAWEEVSEELRRLGHHTVAVTLPGLDPDDADRAAATLDDQADRLRTAIAEAADHGDGVVLVAHSGAGTPTSVLLDRNPSLVGRAIYLDSGPTLDGQVFDPDLPDELDDYPLPPFGELQASLDGLSEDRLARFRERAVPEPAPVMRERVRLTNDARRDVPTTVIACSIPSQTMLQLARDGVPMMAEVANLRDLDVVDLPTGHWPMWSRPHDLAVAIADAAGR